MDHILIRDLLVRCVIGVKEDERREKQDVVMNIELSVDLSRAGATDDVSDTVDYRALKKQLLSLAESSSYHLVEALAEAVAALCLRYPQVAAARVRVEKPGALRFARSVGVEIVRGRP